MSVRINRIQLPLQSAAGSSHPTRSLWLGYVTSGVTHLAGGLLLGSVWGTSLIQLVPPPHATNAIQLSARHVVAVDATLEDAPAEATPVTTLGVETPDTTSGGIQAVMPQLRADHGEMPPASFGPERLEAGSVAGFESSPPLERTTPPNKRSAVRPPDAEPALALKKTAIDHPPNTPSTAGAPALPSQRQQGQDAESPEKIYSPAPAYPADALRQGITGRVVLRVRVAADGNVLAASVLKSSGHAGLDDAALAGVRQWRFQPAKRLGVSIDQEIAVPITFRIDR